MRRMPGTAGSERRRRGARGFAGFARAAGARLARLSVAVAGMVGERYPPATGGLTLRGGGLLLGSRLLRRRLLARGLGRVVAVVGGRRLTLGGLGLRGAVVLACADRVEACLQRR